MTPPKPRFFLRTKKAADRINNLRCRMRINGKAVEFCTDIRISANQFKRYTADGLPTTAADVDSRLTAQLAVWRSCVLAVARSIPKGTAPELITSDNFASAVRAYMLKRQSVDDCVIDSLCVKCGYYRNGQCACPHLVAEQRAIAPAIAEQCGMCLLRNVGGVWMPAQDTTPAQLYNRLMTECYGK